MPTKKCRRRLGVSVSLATVCLLFFSTSLAAEHTPVRGRHGAVASAEAHASEAGIEILKRGGNAVDAAVAVGFALAVTHPLAGNIGGGGFMLVRTADGRSMFLDYREAAPAAARPDMYLDANGNYIPDSSITGYRAVAVPGSVAGMAEAVRRLGKLSLAEDMAPAIRLAEQGYQLDFYQAEALHAKNLSEFPASRVLFQRNGRFYSPGEIFRQPELAATLRAIAQRGPSAFYHGRIAQRLARFMAQHGGIITTADLASYQPKWRTPLQGRYRGYKVITSPPPSSGGVALLEMLNMLEPTEYARSGFLSAESIHYEAEAMRRTFADRAGYLGDPDFAKVPVAELLSKDYAHQLWSTFRADAASPSSELRAGNLPGYESNQTTHYSVIDASGNAVAVTTTLNNSFGSGVTAEGLGFLLNDEMDDFTSKPGVPNMFGLIQSKANQIEPHKRPLSSMVPTIVTTSDGHLLLVLGSPGGPRIISTVFECLVDVLDFDLNLQQAADAPRVHHQWLPDKLYLERLRFSPDTESILKKMGYSIEDNGIWSDAELAGVDAKTGDRLAATDSRWDGKALTY